MVEPIEIETIFPLEAADLHNKPFGNWWVLGLIPFGIALLIYQNQLKEFLALQQTAVKVKGSHELLKEAYGHPQGSQAFFSAIIHALKTALVENSLLASPEISIEKLPDEGIVGEVRRFFLNIEERRFAGHAEATDDQWLPRAEELWKKVQNQAVAGKGVSHET